MNPLLLSIVAILPIAVVALLLVIFRWPARRAMPISFLVTAGLSILIWQVPLQQVAAASINGLVVALTLLYIIFGAILLLNTLQERGYWYNSKRINETNTRPENSTSASRKEEARALLFIM